MNLRRQIALVGIALIGACGGDVLRPPSPPGKVLGVAVAPEIATLAPGDTIRLRSHVSVENGGSTALRWVSADPSIATVNANGLVTARGAGITAVAARSLVDSLVAGVTTIAVSAAYANCDLTVTPSVATIALGASTRMIAASCPLGLPTPGFAWTSSRSDVARVDSLGTVTGVAPGTAVLVASLVSNPRVHGSATVLVTTGPVARITISPPGAMVTFPGVSLQLIGTVTGDTAQARTLRWRSTNPTVAVVDSTGRVTARAPGATIIVASLARDSTIWATTSLAVASCCWEGPTISLTPSALSLDVGWRARITATAGNTRGTPSTVRWSTTNAKVATVDSTGLVTAVGAGDAVVFATLRADTTMQAAVPVTVNDPPVNTLVPIRMTPSSSEITVGSGKQLTALMSPGVQDVTWSSSDPTVATVDASGRVAGVKAGSAVISATATNNANLAGTAVITVVSASR